MNFTTRSNLIFLLVCLSINHAYADQAKKNLDIQDILQPVTSIESSSGGVTYTFSGSTADHINYIRFCKATAPSSPGASCGTCSTPYWTYYANNGTGISYSTTAAGGTSYTLKPSSIQSYVTSNNLPTVSATYYIGLYVQSTNLVCNSANAYCSTNKDNSSGGNLLCIEADYDENGALTLTREDNGNAVLSTNTTPYLFINNGNTTSTNANTTSVCPASASPFTCAANYIIGSATPNSPYGIAIDPPSKNAYVISRGSAGNSLSCSINSSTGGLNCSTLSFASDLASKSCTAQGIAIDPPGQNAYVTCGNNIYKCALGGSTCIAISLLTPPPSPSSYALSNPTGIAIDPTNSYMGIANAGSGGYLTACKIDGTGCVTGNSGNAIAYVTFDHTGKYLYTGKSTGSSVYSCLLTVTSGNLSLPTTCGNKGSGTTKVFGIALNPSGTNAYIAIQGSTGLINSCAITPGSEISSACTGTSSTGLFTGMQGAAWGNVVGS